jgi:hypothetical protein
MVHGAWWRQNTLSALHWDRDGFIGCAHAHAHDSIHSWFLILVAFEIGKEGQKKGHLTLAWICYVTAYSGRRLPCDWSNANASNARRDSIHSWFLFLLLLKLEIGKEGQKRAICANANLVIAWRRLQRSSFALWLVATHGVNVVKFPCVFRY